MSVEAALGGSSAASTDELVEALDLLAAASRGSLELRERRTAAGLTLKAVADRAGITEGYLSYLERGQRALNPGVLAAIRGALRQLEA